MKKTLMVAVSLLLLGGCMNSSEDDLRTVPVTNNPNLLPRGGGGMGASTGPF